MAQITPTYKRYEGDDGVVYDIENIKARPEYINPMVCIGDKITK